MQDGSDGARTARIVEALAVGEQDPQRSLCGASARVVGVSGAGVVLMSGGRLLGSVCASDAVTEAVEEVQYTMGEGPCVEACRTRAPVLVPDLAGGVAPDWPGFREGALAAGARAAFGFPLLVGPVCIGALDLYHDHPSALTDEQLADAVAVAQVVGRTVLGWQLVAPPGSIAWQLEQVPDHRAAVHQATGMVSVQAVVALADALVLLRAFAFAEGRPISDVAAGVVDGSVRFDDAPPGLS